MMNCSMTNCSMMNCSMTNCSMMNLCNTKYCNLSFIPHHVIYKTGFFFFNFWCGVEVFPGIAVTNGGVHKFSKNRGKIRIF